MSASDVRMSASDVRMSGGHQVGIDIGGTSIRAAVLGDDLEVVAVAEAPTPAAEDLVDGCADLVARLGATPTLIGVGVAGRVEPEIGSVFDAVNLGIGADGLALGRGIADAVGAEVWVENDVNAATLGVAERLGPDDDRVLAYLSVGTGIAAGLLVGRRLLRGATGLAGEIGHLPLDPHGPPCGCGQRGCVETTASGGAMRRDWPADLPLGTAADLAASAAAGHRDAARLWDRTTGGLAWAVQLLTMTVGPDVIVLGGGLADAGSVLLDGVRRHLDRLADTAPLVAPAGLADRLLLAPADELPGCVGALVAARQATEADR